MKNALFLLALLVVGCASNTTTPKGEIPAAELQARDKEYTIILSMDGFRWDLAQTANTPTLDSLRACGTYAQVMPIYPSNTFPSHYSMATGLYPNNHGVVNNSFYDETLGRKMSVFNREDVRTEGFWGGEPIWNTVERQGRTANIFMWPGSDVPINGRQATVWTPYDGSMPYHTRADKVVSAMSNANVEEIPELVMWYVDEPDGTMHRYGPNSREAAAQAERVDSMLTYFFRNIRRSPVYDKINFIVTADHGMTAVSSERYVNLYNVIDSTKVNYAIPYRPATFDVDEAYVDEALEKINAQGHLKAYRSELVPEKYHYGTHPTRIGNITVMPDMGWSIGYSSTDDGSRIHGGAHGYDPYHTDMQMVFYASGPAFKEGGYEHPTFQNQNIYMILCYLTGVAPAANDGEWESIEGLFR